jgi:hypothetical protein
VNAGYRGEAGDDAMTVLGTGVPIFTTDIERTLERYKALTVRT